MLKKSTKNIHNILHYKYFMLKNHVVIESASFSASCKVSYRILSHPISTWMACETAALSKHRTSRTAAPCVFQCGKSARCGIRAQAWTLLHYVTGYMQDKNRNVSQKSCHSNLFFVYISYLNVLSNGLPESNSHHQWFFWGFFRMTNGRMAGLPAGHSGVMGPFASGKWPHGHNFTRPKEFRAFRAQ